MRRASIIALMLLAPAGAGCGGEDAGPVRGDGYQYELPEGWENRSDKESVEEISVAGFTPDTFVTAEPDEGFADNVNVLIERSIAPGVSARDYARDSARTLRNPDLLPAELREAIGEVDARDISGPSRIELDGAEAYATDYTGNREGRVLRFRYVVAVRAGSAYGITYTALRHRFREHVDEANQVIETWAWR